MPAKCRKADEVHTIYCDVELSRHFSIEAASGMTQELCKYLLFMRNQIPQLYDDLRSRAEDASAAATTSRRSGKQRKSDKFVAAADQLLSSLSPELFAAAPDTDIIFLLGTSPMRPQEIYSITCSTGSSASQSVEIKSEQSSPSYSATAAKVVLRKLTLATAAGPEGPASKGATKLFVLVKRPADSGLLPGFLPKRGFQIRMRKGLQVGISVRGGGQCRAGAGQGTQKMADSQASEMSWSQAGAQSAESGCCMQQNSEIQDSHDKSGVLREQQLADGPEHIWYQSTISLKGITQVSSQPMDGGGFM